MKTTREPHRSETSCQREPRRPPPKSNTASPEEGNPPDMEDMAEILFGRPVLPIDAFAFGRSFGRRAGQLFPEKLLHVLRGVRAGITEIAERRGGSA